MRRLLHLSLSTPPTPSQFMRSLSLSLFSGSGRLGSRYFHQSHVPIPPTSTELFHISSEVREAVAGNAPVVALESAIITHGMPFPDNIHTAFRLETVIRELGVIPATVGVLGGRLQVGLTSEEIEFLGSSAKKNENEEPLLKVSRRDLPFVMSHKLSGGTTVAGTIIAAVKSGIGIFATGGLGGVHRGAETSFDVSADLKELGRSPIAVVSSGVKSILDIGKTLEYMETEGICVTVLEKKDSIASKKRERERIQSKIGSSKFPSFFTPESPFSAPYTVWSEAEAGALIHSAFQARLHSGVLIAVPIPKEEGDEIGKVLEDAINSAVESASKRSIQGKDITPFLLSEVNRLTAGLSLKANKHLIENNVRSACGIAKELARLRSLNGNGVPRSPSKKFPSMFPFPPNKTGGEGSGVSGTGHSNSRGSLDSLGVSLECSRSHQQQGTENSDEFTTGLLSSSSSPLTQPSPLQQQRQQQIPRRHERPVVIGGTSLDLVIAIQEKEIVVTRSSNSVRREGDTDVMELLEPEQMQWNHPIFITTIS